MLCAHAPKTYLVILSKQDIHSFANSHWGFSAYNQPGVVK